MKKSQAILGGLALVVLAAGVAGVSAIVSDEDDQIVSFEDVPAKVLATIQEQAGDNEIIEIEKEMENGEVVYEAEVIIDGKEVDILVSASGEFLGTETDDDDDDDDDDDGDDDDD